MSRGAASGRQRWRPAGSKTALTVAVALLAGLVYANSVLNEFVFDDRLVIEKNSVVQGEGGAADLLLSPYHQGVGQSSSGLYRPVTLLSFAINYRWGGLDTLGYHLVNILLHAAVSVLVLLLGLRLGLTRLAAAAGGLLFAVHPIHSEVVANLAGRAELLSALFFLAALLAYAGAVESRGLRFAALAGLSCFLALLSKENAVTVPAVALAWELLVGRPSDTPVGSFFRRRWREVASRQAALLVALAVYLVLRAVALGGDLAGPREISPIDNPLVETGLGTRLATAAVVAVRYLWLLVFPLRLSPDYSWAQLLPVSPWSPGALGALALLGALLAVLVASARRSRTVVFLGSFMILAFSVTSNVVVLIGTIMAERLLYLPSVGFCLLLGCGAGALARRVERRWALIVLIVAVALASGRVVVRNRDWRDGLTLFTSAAATSPRSVRVQNNLGTELVMRGRYAEAREAFTTALELAPDYTTARLNLAQCLIQAGDPAAAESEVLHVLSREPDSLKALFQLGEIQARTGRLEEAERSFREIVARRPSHAEAHQRLGAVRMALGATDEAERALREALRLAPDSATAHNDLALLYRTLGRAEESLNHSREAVRLSPSSVPMRNNLANALRDLGRLDESAGELRHALEIDPDFAPTHYNLGLTLERAGRADEAAASYRRAVEIRPDRADAHRALGRLALAAGDREEAIGHLDEAVRLDDTDEEAHALRARASFALGRHAEAETDYLRVLDLNPRSVAARNNLGIIYALRGEIGAARQQWEEALRLAPDSREIRENLRKLGPPAP